MRILFTTQPQHGHLHWLLPLARTLAARGHDVSFASTRPFCPVVEAFGFRCSPAGLDWAIDPKVAIHLLPELAHQPPSRARRDYFEANFYAGVTARKSVPDLVHSIRAEGVDLVVREQLEYGGCVAAEIVGIPHVAVETILFYPDQEVDQLAAVLGAVRSEYGLPPDPDCAMPFRHLLLSPVPVTLQYPGVQLPPTYRSFRTSAPRANDHAEPAWFSRLGTRPLVHATMGTHVGGTHAVYDAVLRGLAEENIDLVLAVGREHAAEDWGPQPPNVYIEPFVAHASLLPRCDVVITHASLNTSLWALSLGIPLLAIPFLGDQPTNAARFAELGAARALERERVTPDLVRTAVRALLDDAAYARAARGIRADFDALPDVDTAASLVEAVARGGATG